MKCDDQRLAARQLWRPKFSEMTAQCPSCPFRVGNDKEFGEVCSRLRNKDGLNGKVTKAIIRFARLALLMDMDKTGDFLCHQTAYDSDMNQRPQRDWRQCAGATKIYRTGQLPK